MSPLEANRLIRIARGAGYEAGRTDDGGAVWVKVYRADLETRDTYLDTARIMSPKDMAALFACAPGGVL
jgi:hypothetical protein